jgi:hypothetical protein
MRNRLLIVAACLATAAMATPSAQSDLDDLMARVLTRRDDNWKKLQQYTLNERETVQITALAVFRLYGFQREYIWFPRAGFFIRSPLEADGVKISEADRQQAEDKWLRRAQGREERLRRPPARRDRCAPPAGPDDAGTSGRPEPDQEPVDDTPFAADSVEDIVSQSFEPDFIRSANFLQFKFDAGQYALVGREKMLNRDVLKIEYYPKVLFRDDDRCPKPADAAASTGERGRRGRDDDDDFDDKLEEKMNKVSLVTLWVDPAENQILRYEFRNIDMDFLPARRIVHIDGLTATMQMSEPFHSVWLPASIAMRFKMMTAVGPFDGRYDVKYTDYRLPTVTGRVR